MSEIDIPSSIDVNTFLRILEYVYSGSVHSFGKLKNEEVISLLAASIKYEGLERLSFLCKQHLTKELNNENIFRILKAVDDLQMKEFKNVLLHFALKNYNEFVGNKEAIKNLGINLFHEVVALKNEGLKPLEEEKEPKEKFMEDCKSLYDSVKQSDITFVMSEPNAMGNSGTVLRAHKAIVIGRAPGLQTIVNQSLFEVSKSVFGVNVKGISPESFEVLFLKWIYYNETQIPTSIACELIYFCQQYGILNFQKVCLDNVKSNLQVDSVLSILNISYLKENMPQWFTEEMDILRPKCIQFVAKHLKEIDFEKLRTKKLQSDIATDILLFLQKNGTQQ